jgi:2-C-methyl-D-erythritol 4-phosphate cytidylyltransferase / 2-C-methyl-D-erythritol 2,4-cyclodiphosphate synthase
LPHTVALVAAAGRGSRFGGDRPKQYAALAGMPVLRRTLAALRGVPEIDAMRCIVHPDDGDAYREAVAGLDLLAPVPGGASRQESVRFGLESLADAPPAIVLIHDAARPFVDRPLVLRLLRALSSADGAIPGRPVTDTLTRVADGRTAGSIDRAGLVRAQTPQAFRYDAILAAHRAASGRAHTDDAGVAEAAGLSVAVVPGSEDNIKLTTPEDMERAAALLARDRETRIGTGFDVHALGPGDHVVICGVRIPHEGGLVGHSDADVGLHALTDALLGAVACGDIGSHFPPSDPRWRGADSALFLAEAARLVRAAGGSIVNVDVTLICERPKIGPLREAMRARIADILAIDTSRVSVKATTTERLGFAGREEGIAAQAAASVAMPSPGSEP